MSIIAAGSLQMRTILQILLLSLTLSAAYCQEQNSLVYQSELLEIEQISANTLLHRSFLILEQWGKFGCNGLVYINSGEAIIFDTPVNDSASAELIDWIQEKRNTTIKAVVINHFHNDCLGGLSTFHRQKIPSYSLNKTRILAEKDTANKAEIPQNGFEGRLVLNVGKAEIINLFPGEGHTADNIVSYIPSENVLFGGCLIKALGTGKGNLNDANTRAWSESVKRVKEMFPNVKTVVPGHGQHGNTDLLDYTIKMFTQD